MGRTIVAVVNIIVSVVVTIQPSYVNIRKCTRQTRNARKLAIIDFTFRMSPRSVFSSGSAFSFFHVQNYLDNAKQRKP